MGETDRVNPGGPSGFDGVSSWENTDWICSVELTRFQTESVIRRPV